MERTPLADKPLKVDVSEDLVGATSDPRSSRALDDRPATEDRVVTDADRLAMFQQSMFNDALPDLPRIAGYHLCWLTTTNPRDPIHRRMQLGYEPLTPEDVPGMQYASLKTGEYAGMIGVNEMVAFKLPMSLYEAFMHEAHHNAPLQEEEKLQALVDDMRYQAEKAGAALIEGDGMEDLRAPQPQRGVYAP
jgi:hypothetical protein